MVKDRSKKGAAWAHLDPVNDEKGGTITIARRINQKKTSEYANSDAKKRFNQNTYPYKNEKIVYETITIPHPVYITVNYSINIKTQYQQQMNQLLQPFITRCGAVNQFKAKHEGHEYLCFIQDNFTNNSNMANLQQDERKFETTIEIQVFGYLIGDDKNENRPKIVIRENAVDVKFGKEETVVDSELPWEKGKYYGMGSLVGRKNKN